MLVFTSFTPFSSMCYRYPAPALLALAGLLLARPATAQTAPDISPGNTYQFTKPVLVSSYNLTHPAGTPAPAPARPVAPAPPVTYLIPAGYRFVVIATEAGGTVIHFLKFKSPAAPKKTFLSSATQLKSQSNALAVEQEKTTTDLNTNLVATRLAGRATQPGSPVLDPTDSGKEQLFFLITDADLSAKVARWYPLPRRPEVAAGTVILPVKMRLAPFDFSRDFALGLTVGPRWRVSHFQQHYLNALFAFNANIVTIDSLSTNGKTRRPADLGALGTALGLVFDFNGPQVGVFAGLDWLSHRDQVANNWRYQGSPWLSVGVGFTLFTRNVGAPAPTAPASQTTPAPAAR